MFHLADFEQHIFHDGIITECRNWSGCSTAALMGEFPEEEAEENGCKYFYFQFNSVESKLPEMDDAGIISFEISERKDEKKGYHVKICAENNGFILAEFSCMDIRFCRRKYQGISYRNMYQTAEYHAFIESQKYVVDNKYFMEKERFELPEGFSIEVKTYADVENTGKYSVNKAFLQKCTLRQAEHAVYEYICTYRHRKPFLEFIYHSNGHRYYPFHINLYGISYIDIDTMAVYNYIPEGYQHDCDILFGESFIITDIHYNRESNLIAYGGCFWAGPCDVMIGDFSQPLSYNPKLVGMQEILDPDYEKYDELDFDSWGDGELSVKGNGMSVSIDIDEIQKRLG